MHNADGFYGRLGYHLGTENVLPVFDADQVETLIQRQADLREDGVDNPGLIIMDDLIGAAHFAYDLFTRLACSGRHNKITCWIACQHLFKLPPVLRSNSDYLFILGSSKTSGILSEASGSTMSRRYGLTRSRRPKTLVAW